MEAVVDAGLPEREFSSEPLDNGASAPREGRRSQMDEDLKRRFTSEISEEGLGHSGQPAAHVKRIDGKRLREWHHKDMASHLWAQNRPFECCAGVLVCSHDAARLGKPAEETEVFEVTCRGMNFTTILPNQAHTCDTLLLHAIPCRCNAILCCCMQYLVVAFKFPSFYWVLFFEMGCGRDNAIAFFWESECVQATATALQCSASRVAGTEHTAGCFASEAMIPEVEAESVQVPREQQRQDAEDQSQSQGPR